MRKKSKKDVQVSDKNPHEWIWLKSLGWNRCAMNVALRPLEIIESVNGWNGHSVINNHFAQAINSLRQAIAAAEEAAIAKQLSITAELDITDVFDVNGNLLMSLSEIGEIAEAKLKEKNT